MPPASNDSLIGRDRELEQLRRLLHAGDHGAPATAFIEGEAGIGKTRLLRSLTDAAQASGLTVLRGTAHPLERNRPFGPLVDALGLRPGAKDPRRAALGRLLTGESVVLTPGPTAGQLVFRAIEEILDVLERASDAGPVLLGLDDLHWAESSTLLAINWMTRRLTEIPLLLVATLRPAPRSHELSQLLDDARRSGAELISLTALPAHDVEVLVESELGLPPGASLAAAVERAAGNPLWVVELLRALSAEGALDLTGDRAEAVSSDLPNSVRQLVARRLGFLPEQTVAALRTASLFGEAFSLTDMATVTGRRVTELVDDLGPAFQAQLVADHRGVLVFRHQLVRDAIYEEIPEGARLALHRETAAALDGAGAPIGKVASQLILGSTPPDPDAAAQLRDAALEAAPSSPGVAARLLQRADELLPPGHPERDFVLAELTECLTLSGHSGEATALAEEVLARPHAAAIDHRLRLTLIAVLSLQRRPEELIAHAQQALDRSPDIPPRDQAVILGLSSFGRQFGGDLPGAEQDALRGLDIAERARDQAMTAWNLTALGGAMDSQGRYIEAVEVTTRAVDVAFDPPDVEARLRHPHMLQGIALCDADRLDDAAAALRTAAEDCAALQSDQLLADIQLLAAEVRLLRGEWDEAVPQIEGGIEFAREHGNLITLPRFQAYLALVAAACGNDAGAALALAPFTAELAGEASCYGAEFLFHAAAVRAELAGDPATALGHLERFWRVGMAPANRHGHRFIAPATVRLALALGSPVTRTRGCRAGGRGGRARRRCAERPQRGASLPGFARG